MIGWEATRAAIARLQGLLKCLKCGQVLKDPCSLEGCDHSFCRSCIQEEVGSDSRCPECGALCWIKDLKTNRQLSRTVLLCNKLSDIINPGSDTDNTAEDDEHKSLQVVGKDDTATTESGFESDPSAQDVTENSERCPALDDSQHVNETVIRRREYDRNADVFGSQTVSNTPLKRIKTPTKTYGNKNSRNRAKKFCSPVDSLLNDSGILENFGDNPCSGGGKEVDVINLEDDDPDQEEEQCRDESDEERGDVDMNTSDSSEVVVFDMETTPSPPKTRKLRNTPKSGTAARLKGKRVRGKSANLTPGKPAWMKKNARGETPLHIACIKGDVASVENLFSQGADPNLKDNAGWTPLHEACNHGFTQIVSILLDHGAVIDVPGFELETPLHDAVSNSRVEVVRLLVARGASLTAKNHRGLTAREYAQSDIMKDALTPSTLLNNEVPATTSGPQTESAAKGNTSTSSTPKVLLATGLSANEKEQFNKCAKTLGATILTDYHNDVTHVVCSVNKDGHCLRTMKYLLGILSGKWIVRFSWISKCVREKRWVHEEEYEVEGTSQTHVLAPKRSRENTLSQLPPLFDGCHFFLYGSFVSPTPKREDIQELLRAGGGSILTREPKSDNEAFREPAQTRPYHLKLGTTLGDCSKYIVYDPLAERKPKLVRTPSVCTVPVSWIMSCISHFELRDFSAEDSGS